MLLLSYTYVVGTRCTGVDLNYNSCGHSVPCGCSQTKSIALFGAMVRPCPRKGAHLHCNEGICAAVRSLSFGAVADFLHGNAAAHRRRDLRGGPGYQATQAHGLHLRTSLTTKSYMYVILKLKMTVTNIDMAQGCPFRHRWVARHLIVESYVHFNVRHLGCL